MIRTPLALVPYLIWLAAIVGGWISYQADVVAGTATTFSHRVDIGGPFRLIDQTGAIRTDKDFRGRFMLVYFGYTDCPDVCPTTLNVMADALGELGGLRTHIVPVFITVDPKRDTPKVLKDYLDSFGKAFVGLTGSTAAIAKVAKAYHVYYVDQPLKGGGYSVTHSSTIYLMGPEGHFITYYDETIGPDGLAADLRRRL